MENLIQLTDNLYGVKVPKEAIDLEKRILDDLGFVLHGKAQGLFPLCEKILGAVDFDFEILGTVKKTTTGFNSHINKISNVKLFNSATTGINDLDFEKLVIIKKI